jgi:hypothetical protein
MTDSRTGDRTRLERCSSVYRFVNSEDQV